MDSQTTWTRRLTGAHGIAAAFLWGLAEGTFFFIVPDVLLSLAALFAPRRVWRHIVAAIAGAVLGGALLFGWAAHDSASAYSAIAKVPFVTPKMLAAVPTSYEAHGIGAVFLGPLSGIPYKIYAIEAPQFLGAPALLAATIPARGERFLLIWLLFGALGTWLRRLPSTTPRRLVILHTSVWVIFYLFYWGRIVLR